MKRGLSGLGELIMPFGETKRRDTFTCGHCQRIRHVEPGGRYFLYPNSDGKLFQCEYTRCGQCNDLICERCIGKGCTPFEKQLELMERRAALYEAVREGKP